MFPQIRGHVGVHVSETVERSQCQMQGKPTDQSHYSINLVSGEEARHLGRGDGKLEGYWRFSVFLVEEVRV